MVIVNGFSVMVRESTAASEILVAFSLSIFVSKNAITSWRKSAP